MVAAHEEPVAQARDAQLVDEAAGTGVQVARGVEGIPQRVGQARKAAVVTDQRAGIEGPQAQTLVVERAARLGVRGQQHLEAAVEPEAVHFVGAQATSGRVASLEDQDVHAPARQLAGAAQPGQAGADDDDVAQAQSPSSTAGSTGLVAPGSTRSQ